MPERVSVIVPTVGRPELQRAVGSALSQGVSVEVVVVNDSGHPLPGGVLDVERLGVAAGSEVRVLDTPGRTGAAAARNVGLQAAAGTHCAFLDDDDVWLDGHLQRSLAVFEQRPDTTIVFARGLVLDDDGTGRIEPAELLGDRTLAQYNFEVARWRSRSRRVLTSTVVFRSDLHDHPMVSGMQASEDTWWLLTAERQRGATVRQSPHIGIIMHGSPQRVAEREAARDVRAWADQLEALVPGAAAAQFNATRARDAARAGRPGQVLALARASSHYPGAWRWSGVVAAHTAVATAVRARQGLRGLARRTRS